MVLRARIAIIPSYVVWVLSVGSTGLGDAARYGVSRLTYGSVGGAATACAYRASRLRNLPPRVRDGWRLLALAFGPCWVAYLWAAYLMYSQIDDVLAPLPLARARGAVRNWGGAGRTGRIISL